MAAAVRYADAHCVLGFQFDTRIFCSRDYIKSLQGFVPDNISLAIQCISSFHRNKPASEAADDF